MTDSEEPLDLEAVWTQLEKTDRPGTHFLALHPVIGLSASIDNPDKSPGLLLQTRCGIQFEPSELVGSEHLGIEQVTESGRETMRLVLNQPASRGIFVTLCQDIVPRVLAAESEAAAATMLVRRFNAWQRSLKRNAGKGLSGVRQRGLFGELVTLRDLLIPSVGAAKSVEAWVGPENRPQDFQLAGIAVEVKTVVHSEPQQLKISGERQLDDFGLEALVVAHHRIIRHHDAGLTLPVIVESLREAIAGDEGPVDVFDDKLLIVGYADHHASEYEQDGYSLRESSYYRVQQGFPRLTESDLVPGLGALSYTVDASACTRFTVEEEVVASWFTDPPEVVDIQSADETFQVEYKQTAWTPTDEPKTTEHRVALERDLKTGIIKTVVAFLNTAGGELVIGVKDDNGEVTGIEVDLEYKDKSPTDQDYYRRELAALFSDCIDNRVHDHLRIRFESHESGTACHVNVRPSPRPRFGTPPSVPNEKRQPTFWVRAFNTTKTLEGHDIVDWIEDHWS